MTYCGTEKDGTKYFYEEGFILIKRLNGDVNKLHKKNMPDPYDLWEKRCKQLNVNKQSTEGIKLKPTQITFKLWEAAHADTYH